MHFPTAAAVPSSPPALSVLSGVDADSRELVLHLRAATVGGTLLFPRAGGPVPCVVLVGGTLSRKRDGELDRPDVPRRSALKRLAEALAGAGYGSFRYDQVGHGASRAKAGYTDLYSGDAEILADIYAYLRSLPECGQVIAAGESAGAYVACLAARAGAQADGYLFLGGFCGQPEEIFSYNYGRLADYVESDSKRRAWAESSHLARDLAFGRRWPEMFAAARAGQADFEVADGSFRQTVSLARRREELDNPPDEMFAYIRKPALAIAGSRDLNVAPHHAAYAVAVMQKAGNLGSRAVLIEEADHNVQISQLDPDVAFRERYTFASLKRPYHPRLDREILAWLNEVAPVNGNPGHDGEPPREPAPASADSRARYAPEIEPRTAASPERLHLAPGVTIIEDILDSGRVPGIETLEGRIGPLLRAPDMRAHYIDMPAGLYLGEHPHAKGSIIYTARGRWGLESRGRWHLMAPGSLFWFGDDIPTGYQVPFRENAFVLIFKAAGGDDDEAFMSYLRDLATRLETERGLGTAFQLADLPPSHSALEFASKVNPRFTLDFSSSFTKQPRH